MISNLDIKIIDGKEVSIYDRMEFSLAEHHFC